MRNKIIFGNWKLNNDLTETVEFCFELRKFLQNDENMKMLNEKRVIIGLAPQSPLLQLMIQHSPDEVWVIAQNVSAHSTGAFTGEVSTDTLLSIGVSTVLIGHSERRNIFKEANKDVHLKTQNALNKGMNVVLCCGESQKIREKDEHFEFVEKQLKHALKDVPILKLRNLYIAYEPIWAIGTGKTATANDAEKMCSRIRLLIQELYTKEMSNHVHILYGGSVKPFNIKEICEKKNIDGVLVGGASVKATSYINLLTEC